MSKTIQAVYDNGVFRPLEPVELPDQARISITLNEEDDDDRPWRGVFVVEYPEKVTGRCTVSFRDGEQPKWNPPVTLEARWFEDDDE